MIATTQKNASPARSTKPIAWLIFASLTTALLGVFAYLVVMAPTEMQMGVAQKIFYLHVPSAYAMYLGFGACALGSLAYLALRKPLWDAMAVAGGEIGLLFSSIVLLTGPLWARKAWGVFWTWDPRLTTTLLAALIFASFVVLRSLGSGGEAEKRMAAALAVLGLVALPFIHFSVQMWRGQHPTVLTKRGGGVSADMLPALVTGFTVVTLLFLMLFWLRTRIELTRTRLLELQDQDHDRDHDQSDESSSTGEA